MTTAIRQLDKAVARYLSSGDDAGSARLLGTIAQLAQPLVIGMVRAKVRRPQDLEDLVSECILTLLTYVQHVHARQIKHGHTGIDSPMGCICSVVKSVLADYYRRQDPHRTYYRNILRQLATEGNGALGLALWRSAEGRTTLLGPDQWQGGTTRVTDGYLKWRNSDPATWREWIREEYLNSRDPNEFPTEGLMMILFDAIRTPIPLEEASRMLCDTLGEREMNPRSGSDERTASTEPVAHTRVSAVVVARDRMRTLWRHIAELPKEQRCALLLGLAGEDAIELARAVTLNAFAAALGTTEQECAGLFAQLPLPDRAIAQRLGASRQRVINLRKTARARLKRHAADSVT